MDVDSAFEIEGRYFVDLATGQVAKNMIQAFFFDLQAVNGSRGRPDDDRDVPGQEGRRPGRGHDGRGHRVPVREVAASRSCSRTSPRRRPSAARATRRSSSPRASSAARSPRRRARPCSTASRRPTTPSKAEGADLVIEAVFEDPKVKEQVFGEIEPHLAEGALLGSNTSTLPITGLAEYVSRPERLHRAALLQPGGQDAAAGDHQGREDDATRRSTARSTSPSRSARRRSSSTTRAASSPRA